MPITREQLIHTLTEAAEIEHNLLCSYLYAAFSLKRGEGLSERQAQAVEGWRKTVLGVAVEEMSHLAIVNNLLVAVGGAAHFDRPNLPVAPGYHPADIVVRLTPFDEATLDHFIFLERPEDEPLSDGEGFDAEAYERGARAGSLTPSAQDYATIGDLYRSIGDGLRSLAARLGEGEVIDARGLGQVAGEAVGMPDVPPITDLKTALAAIDRIVEEGEGSSATSEDSHFKRFVSIREEWAELRADDPSFAPAHPAAENPVMRRPVDADRVWIVEPRAAAYVDAANALYGLLLSLLVQTYGDGEAGRPKALMDAAIEVMHACGTLGGALARMPADPERPGVNAGMTFAVPRSLGARPRRLLEERIGELAAGCARVLSPEHADPVLERLEKAKAAIGPGA